jgi:23S rRNA pseudouridine1911/1915/1917 synthase
MSGFRELAYCEHSDSTLLECTLYTGRTHQLRLHLQLLGNPIANDPCYGGELFYGAPEQRQLAIDALRAMRARGLVDFPYVSRSMGTVLMVT